VGRERELDALEKQYLLPESNLIPIYGRRRVGKSELILHFKGNRGPVLSDSAAKLWPGYI
jgi:AAA+ ATPase superfamily predicted ATPase